jgi:hypothetical protein
MMNYLTYTAIEISHLWACWLQPYSNKKEWNNYGEVEIIFVHVLLKWEFVINFGYIIIIAFKLIWNNKY